jgi:hypothetical protein
MTIDIGVRSVVFELDDTVDVGDKVFGVEPVWKLGYFWFMYGKYAGKLQFVNHRYNIWFPEDHSASGYGWNLNPEVSGVFHTLYNQLPALNIQAAGASINVARGITDGLRQIGPTGLTGAAPSYLKGYISKNRNGR